MAGYLGTTPVPQSTQHREAFTATASQTSFATAGYTPQFLDVYLNGVKLAAADYTATNGSDIVLTTGAALDDILEYVAYTPFEVASQTFTGTTTVTDSGAAPLVANRTTSDGDIIDLQKDGTTVGRIGINGRLTIDGSSDGTGIYFGGGAWLPRDSGAIVDATVGLGGSTQRFTDLYLSGGVYLGGTGAANKLDDYEEGTFTPTLEFGGASVGVTYSVQGGYYTKVGQSVTFSCYFVLSSKGTSTGTAVIKGLPFVSYVSAASHTAVSLRPSSVSFADVMTGYITTAASQVQLTETTNAGANSSLNDTNFSNASSIMVAGSYTTAS